MRGRTLVRMAALLQAVLLAGALLVPASVAAATLGFTLNTPTLSTVAYSDLVVLRGSYTCSNDGVSNCGTGTQSHTATFALRPAGGSGFTTVGTVATSFSFTSSSSGCPTTCSVPFQVTWKAGRAGAVTIPPGTYDIGLTNTIAAGQLVLLNGLTVAAEATTTTYGGLASGMGGTSFSLAASVADQDRGLSSGTGIFSPDANLFGAGLVTFELYDATNTTIVAGPVSATLLGTGLVTGSPSLMLPAAGGTFKLRTTFVGNAFYTTSSDLDTITVTSSNTAPVLTVPAGLMVVEATSPAGKAVSFSVSAADAEDDPDPTASCLPASGSVFPIGDTSVTCTVTDSGGLSDEDTFVVSVVDTLNPGVGIGTDESDNGAGWYNVASNDGVPGVTVNVVTGDAVGVTDLSCTDDGTDVGPLDPAGDEFVVGDGSHAIECTATDAAGNHSTDTASFSVDQTAPSIAAALDLDPDPTTGWWNAATGAPTVTYSCADAGSGLASCSAPRLLGDGAGQNDTGTALDLAGNSATASVSDLDVDLTAPTIGAVLTPDSAAAGWWNLATGAPTVTFSCSDATSGVADPGCPAAHAFGDGAGQSFGGTIHDVAGNEASAGVSGVDVDLVAPSISAALTPSGAASGWWNVATGAPTVTYTCGDAGSGLASCTSPATFGEGADQTHTGSAIDVAGNSSSASVTNVDVDLTAPTSLSFVGGGLAPGGAYLFGSVPAGPTGCTATDAVSGLASCQVAGYSPLVGSRTITGTARDAAGNQAQGSFGYSVLPWTLRGFGNPISTAGVNSAKAGTASNLKFEVFAGTTELSSLDAVANLLQTQVSCTTLVPVGPTTSALGNKSNSLKYDGGQYMAKWDSPSQPGTCWIVSIVTADGSSLSATFQLK